MGVGRQRRRWAGQGTGGGRTRRAVPVRRMNEWLWTVVHGLPLPRWPGRAGDEDAEGARRLPLKHRTGRTRLIVIRRPAGRPTACGRWERSNVPLAARHGPRRGRLGPRRAERSSLPRRCRPSPRTAASHGERLVDRSRPVPPRSGDVVINEDAGAGRDGSRRSEPVRVRGLGSGPDLRSSRGRAWPTEWPAMCGPERRCTRFRTEADHRAGV